jgi:hypothetical protein
MSSRVSDDAEKVLRRRNQKQQQMDTMMKAMRAMTRGPK